LNQVFGVSFSSLSEPEILELLTGDAAAGMGPRLVVTTNMDHVVNLMKNPEYRAAYASAWLATIDGWPVFLYARLRGADVPSRITGADLAASLSERLDPKRHRVFLIGSHPTTCECLSRQLVERGFHPDTVAWTVPPFGFENDDAVSHELARQIAELHTTHLFFGVGSPKSEMWVFRHRRELGDLLAFGFGAGLDFLAGTRQRAPAWMRRVGLEWFWRLAHEPRRLASRYLLNSWGFLIAIKRDLQAARMEKMTHPASRPH
jgi:N-acetylglucosaminyldiphosphoundecaprenol N-acetyl-beta-D-mannosaminyltransferase